MLLLGRNTVTGEMRTLAMGQNCKLYPVTDDMAMCKPISDNKRGYLEAQDAEKAWFVRVNHIRKYGTDPYLKALTVQPKDPLLFLNIDAVAGSTALIWEHVEDSPGKRCPNPRVILPRTSVPNVVNGKVEVMVRSFGIRTPPCTRQKPSYGIVGYLHMLPPSLAWLWRLVAPRGYDKGAGILDDFFKTELKKFIHPALDPLGKNIIDCCMDSGTLHDYENALKFDISTE